MKPHLSKALLFLLATSIATLTACREKQPERTPPEHVYEMRGVVTKVDRENGAEVLTIHHESVPNFIEFDGTPTTMESMTMPFPLAPSVNAEAVQPGDEIAFTYEMRWRGNPREEVTKVTKLPAGSVKFETGAGHEAH